MERGLTEDDYAVAKKNGIPRSYAHTRVFQLGWEKERAITEKVKEYTGLWKKYQAECEKIGLARTSFLKRVSTGMTPELASRLPVMTNRRSR